VRRCRRATRVAYKSLTLASRTGDFGLPFSNLSLSLIHAQSPNFYLRYGWREDFVRGGWKRDAKMHYFSREL
jgi:hypothetical protein